MSTYSSHFIDARYSIFSSELSFGKTDFVFVTFPVGKNVSVEYDPGKVNPGVTAETVEDQGYDMVR